jgi:hypothetical protein
MDKPGNLRKTCSDYSADEVDAREVRFAQISGMPSKGFLSDVIMVKAVAASGMVMSEGFLSSNLFVILLLFRHGSTLG